MANEKAAILDLESEIPFTAIVDINQANILNNTVIPDKPKLMSRNEEPRQEKRNFDIKFICRICLLTENNMIPLISKIGPEILANMFTAVTSINVNLTDNLPLQICLSCHNDIVHWYKFKIKCNNANNFLKTKFKRENYTSYSQYDKYTCRADKETQTFIDDINEENKCALHDITKIKTECVLLHNQTIDGNDDHEEIEFLEDDTFFFTDISKEITKHSNSGNKLSNKGGEDFVLSVDKNQTQKIKTKRKLLSCEICSKNFIKSKTLKAHLKQCRNNNSLCRKPYGCGQCKESFICENDLHIHSALHNKGINWTCNRCMKEFTERNRFRRHIRRHMESRRHACDVCGRTFAELCALRRHARVHTGEEREKKYACHLCEKRFSDSSQLRAHVARHTGARPLACEACDKRFPSRRLLASHRRVHSDLKLYACRYCDKRFRHESTRNTHHRTHTGEKPYICSICGKAFIQTSNLKLHMRTHTGEKPYACDICGRKFTSGSSLTCHRRTHTGEKPYGCPVCGKRFARTDIRTHLRQHSGERPFPCCACPKAFINAARLRDHYLIHTGEKPYECAICSEKFKRKNYLVKHIKTHERDTKVKNKRLVIMKRLPLVVDDNIIYSENKLSEVSRREETSCNSRNETTNIITKEIPLEVSGELILKDNCMKTDVVGVHNVQNSLNFQENGDVERFDNGEMNDVNLVTLNEGGVNVSASSVLEGTTTKLYQLDQSLVQIHTSGGQVTIRKITSKMTANF